MSASLKRPKLAVTDLLNDSLASTRTLYGHSSPELANQDAGSQRVRLRFKYVSEYKRVQELPSVKQKKTDAGPVAPADNPLGSEKRSIDVHSGAGDAGFDVPALLKRQKVNHDISVSNVVEPMMELEARRMAGDQGNGSSSASMSLAQRNPARGGELVTVASTKYGQLGHTRQVPCPVWHPPWKLMRVISGHLGWVRSVTVDPSNRWFATGAADRTIKIWDLASGTLRLSLTGHISTVRGLAVSDRHPYLFSVGEDKMIRCWDLEYNKTIRQYHGHLSGIYCVSLHPTLDVLVTGSRDSSARVWDMRTKQQIFALTGHQSTVASVQCQAADPQLLTSSMDSTVRLWDLAAGKTVTTLTHHKKAVRSLVMHPSEWTFASASPDNIKQWKLPEARFLQNLSGHDAIINCLALNDENVLVSGGDNGTLYFWDWKSGYNFQKVDSIVQPGSLESEAGIYAMTFDRSGCRLITCEADKTIKVFKEDESATMETHPIDWRPDFKPASH